MEADPDLLKLHSPFTAELTREEPFVRFWFRLMRKLIIADVAAMVVAGGIVGTWEILRKGKRDATKNR